MSRLRRVVHRAARGAARSLSPQAREVALALGARATDGPALLPGPPPGPVLVIAPHPDDETIGCGGALARHAERGDEITVLVLSGGGATGGGRGDVVSKRETEWLMACRELDLVGPLRFLGLPDGRLDEHLDEMAREIGHAAIDAAVVYAPSLLDPHRDHRAANAALARTRVAADVYGYEVWSAAPVDVLLDVTEVWERKEAALRCYTTALETVDYVRVCAGLAAYRSGQGGLGGAGMAEGFLRIGAEEFRAAVAALGLAGGDAARG